MTDEEYLIKLGKKIKEIRLKNNISQVELANNCDFEKSNMNRIEAGRANTTIVTLRKIAVALNIKVADIIKDLD
jgi:transcriptional regulator with XRE-family HTH domain